jgi:hypothetical protein
MIERISPIISKEKPGLKIWYSLLKYRKRIAIAIPATIHRVINAPRY